MKISEAILKGMEHFPIQAIGTLSDGPRSACVWGCVNYAFCGDPRASFDDAGESLRFMAEYGIRAMDLNDGTDGVLVFEPFPRDVIAGMFKAIGL